MYLVIKLFPLCWLSFRPLGIIYLVILLLWCYLLFLLLATARSRALLPETAISTFLPCMYLVSRGWILSITGRGIFSFLPSGLNAINAARLVSLASFLGHYNKWSNVSFWHLNPGHMLIPVTGRFIWCVGSHPHMIFDV